MARVVLPVVGAVVGYIYGGPTGAQYGWMAGSIIAGVVGSQTRRSVRVNETGAQTTTEGAPRAIIYGAAPVTGNLICTGSIRKVETTEEAKGGGGQAATSVSYYRTYAIRVCEGPITAILVAKRDGKVVFDIRNGSTFQAENDIFTGYTSRYFGTEVQLPDPDLEAIHGVGEVPAHRGSCYVVFTDDDLTSRQGSVPQWEFVVASTGEDDAITLTDATAQTVGGLFGGGTMTGQTTTTTFDNGNIAEGTAFLADFRFTAESGGPYELVLAVYVDGLLAWNATITVGIGESTHRAVQLNHALDSTEVTLVFSGTFIGSFGMGLAGLADNDAYQPVTPATAGSPLIIVESTDPDFGVVQNSAGYARAIYLVNNWRVDPLWDQGTFTPNAVLLSDIVEDIHDRCGASVPDVTELTDEVAGLVLGSADYGGADAIETLRPVYFFDRAEYDGQIHYPKRGANSVATITIDDLVELPDESQREAHPEYPRKLHLGYQALQVNYEVAQATSDRYSPDARVIGEQALQIPVVLDEEQAANLVARMHKVAWADAEGEIKFSLPMRWIGLTPSECIGLDLRNRVRRLRIESIDDADGVRALTCRIDRQSAYFSEAPNFIPLPTPPAPPTVNPGDTVLAVMDISALRDVDDILLNYVAVTGESAAWTGAQTQRSFDDGATFTAAQTITTAAVMGRLVDAVPSASEDYTDTTNFVRVQLIRDGQEITSISDLAFLQGGGGFALEKDDGSWEVMQYRDATDEGDGVFLLQMLHRGLLNSGPSAHSAGALFVLLSGSRAQAADSSTLGMDVVHRAPSIGQSPEDAAEQTQAFVGRSQTEWPVASLALARDGSDVITATWAPRHRLGTDVAPVASINFEGYRVTLDDGVDQVTFDTTSPSFTYDASALAAPVDVTVQSLNRFTGAGPATTDAI